MLNSTRVRSLGRSSARISCISEMSKISETETLLERCAGRSDVGSTRLVDLEPRRRFKSELEGVLRCRQAPNSLSFFSNPKQIRMTAMSTMLVPPGSIRRQRGTREILDVVGDDYFRTCSRRGGQDVAVFRVVCHRGNQVFIAIDPRFRKMSPDFVPAVNGLLGREAEVLLKSSGYFYHDLIRAFWQKETWASGEPEQGVSQGHWD